MFIAANSANGLRFTRGSPCIGEEKNDESMAMTSDFNAHIAFKNASLWLQRGVCMRAKGPGKWAVLWMQ